jgi:hypothetical protein
VTRLQRFALFRSQPRHQRSTVRLEQRIDDALEIDAGLARREHRFGDAAADLAVEVELGFAQIHERKLRQPFDRLLQRKRAFGHGGQQRAKLVFTHR